MFVIYEVDAVFPRVCTVRVYTGGGGKKEDRLGRVWITVTKS